MAIPLCECQQEWLLPMSVSQWDPLRAAEQHCAHLSKNFGLFDFPYPSIEMATFASALLDHRGGVDGSLDAPFSIAHGCVRSRVLV